MTKRTILVAFFGALVLGAGAVDWFDAGISDYAQWPSDGSDFLVPGAGTWTGTSNATLVRTNGLSRLSVTPRGEGDALAFGPEVAKDMSDNLLFRVTATFCVFCELPNADPSFKTALTALEKKNGQVVYCGFVVESLDLTGLPLKQTPDSLRAPCLQGQQLLFYLGYPEERLEGPGWGLPSPAHPGAQPSHPLLQQGPPQGYSLLQLPQLPFMLTLCADLDLALVSIEQLQLLLQLLPKGLEL